MRRSSAWAPMPPASTPCMSAENRCPAWLVGAVAAAVVGLVSGAVILRTTGLTLLMLTLAVTSLLAAAANDAGFITGGNDGLQGVAINPILGAFGFDMFGRTAYLYCLAVLFVGVAVRAPAGAFAVRPLVGRHPRERRAHARHRRAGPPPAADRLYDLRRTRRHRGRVADADHAIRRRDGAEFRTLRRDRHHAGAGRCRAGCTARSSAPRST